MRFRLGLVAVALGAVASLAAASLSACGGSSPGETTSDVDAGEVEHDHGTELGADVATPPVINRQTAQSALDVSSAGQWSAPVVPPGAIAAAGVHAVVLHTGKVLLFSPYKGSSRAGRDPSLAL